jgi:hypothetical protein
MLQAFVLSDCLKVGDNSVTTQISLMRCVSVCLRVLDQSCGLALDGVILFLLIRRDTCDAVTLIPGL